MPNADIVTRFWLIQQTCRLVTVRPGVGCWRLVAAPGRLRTFLVMNPTMMTTHPAGDPRETFLKAQEVIAKYRWGRTRGYLELKKTSFPRTIGGNYRLDTLIAWEEWCLTGDERERDRGTTLAAIPPAEVVPEQASSAVVTATRTDDGPAELPQRRQSRRGRAA
jgi:hypothetical protein